MKHATLPVSQTLFCCGEHHTIYISKSGAFSSPQHSGARVRGLDVAAQLTGRTSPCQLIFAFLRGEVTLDAVVEVDTLELSGEFISFLCAIHVKRSSSTVVSWRTVDRRVAFYDFVYKDLTFYLVPPRRVNPTDVALALQDRELQANEYFDMRRQALGRHAFSRKHTMSTFDQTATLTRVTLPLTQRVRLMAEVDKLYVVPRLMVYTVSEEVI